MAKITTEYYEEYFSDWIRIDGQKYTVLIFQEPGATLLAQRLAIVVDTFEKGHGL